MSHLVLICNQQVNQGSTNNTFTNQIHFLSAYRIFNMILGTLYLQMFTDIKQAKLPTTETATWKWVVHGYSTL